MEPLMVFNYRRNRAYGMHVLMGALEAAGLDAALEARFVADRESLDAALAEGRPTLVAWSFFSPNFPEARAELEWIRTRHDRPDILHVAGGPHATALPRDTLAAGFDRVAKGDGERTFVDLIRSWTEGGDIDSVAGLYRLAAGRAVAAGPADRVDLDAWPPFAARATRFNPIEITRGCVYGCRFCQAPFMAKARFRHRSVARVVEAVMLTQGRGMRDVRFITPSALSYGARGPEADLGAVENLLGSVRETVGPAGRIYFGSFPSEARPEHLTPESVALLKRYVDNDNLVIGAQSGSPRILQALHRGHGVDDVIAAVRCAREAGFAALVDLIFGIPGESGDDVALTLDLAQTVTDLGGRVHAHAFLPLPGTPFAGTPPAPWPEETLRAVERLAGQGRLFGQWQRQRALVPDLAALGRRGDRRQLVEAITPDTLAEECFDGRPKREELL